MQTPSSQSSVAITEAGFGERLKLERTTQGISQKALAELLTAAGFPIDGPGLSRLENGTRSIRLGEAAAIAEVLDVPLVWMVGGTPRSQLRELRRIANRSIDAAVEGLASATMDCYLIQELLERHPDLLSEFTPDEDAGTLTDPSQYIAWVSVRARRVAGDPEGARITWSEWIKQMVDDGLAATTIRTRYNIARGIFRAARLDKVIGTDPTENIALPRARRRDAAMTIPTPAEVARLVDSSAVDQFGLFVQLCAFAGLRLGEAAGVQVGDVDFLRRQLTVSRQIQRDGNKPRIAPPKYGSERTVYLPDDLVTAISEHVAEWTPDGPAERWLFADDAGDPWFDNRVGWRWRKTRSAAGVDFRLHDLRHFYASGLIAAGCDVVTVQRALGHSNATTTLSTYSHLWPDAEDRTRAAVAGLMTTVAESAADALPTGTLENG